MGIHMKDVILYYYTIRKIYRTDDIDVIISF